MSSGPRGESSDDLGALVEATAAWDHSPAAAEQLRAQLGAMVSPRRAPDDARERALLKLRSVYQKRDASSLGGWFVDKPQEARFAAPYIGDPGVSRWPFEDAQTITDREAVIWLELFERAAVLPTDAVREFVRVMFDTRARETWIPAARAFAAIALRCPILREELSEQVRRHLPGGWPSRWSADRLAVGKTRDDADASHHRIRHTVLLICAWLGRGGDPELVGGVSPEAIASTPLPIADDSDASICLLGLVELASRAELRPIVVAQLPKRVEALEPAPMCEAVVRDICEALELRAGPSPSVESGARARLLDWLARDRWTIASVRNQPASLFAWAETASWLARRGELATLDRLRANVGRAGLAIELAQGSAASLDDPVAAVIERLEVTLTPLLLETTLAERRAPLLVELVWLLQLPALASIDWPTLVTRALGPEHSIRLPPGSVGEVALGDLPALLVGVNWPIAWLLRRTPMSREATLAIAGSRSGLVARQVAVTMERLLREVEVDSGPERVRLWWQLLARRPPAETFRQLGLASRGEPILERMIAAGAAVEAGTDEPLGAAAAALVALIDASLAGLGPDEGRTVLAEPRAALVELGDRPALADDAACVLELLRRVLLGGASSERDTGLLAWQGFVFGSADGPAQAASHRTIEAASRRTSSVRAALAKLERTLRSFEAALPVLEHAEHESTRAALTQLADALDLAWPVRAIVDRMLELLRARIEAGEHAAAVSRDLCVELRAILDRGDDEQAVAIALDDQRVALLPVGLTRRLHAFLLDHLRLGVAQSLRRRAGAWVQLPHVVTHLAPLALGVVGGTLLVLDVGQGWMKLAEDSTAGSQLSYALTVGISLLASYLILWTGLTLSHPTVASRSGHSSAAAAQSPISTFAVRVLLVFLGAWALAWATSVLIMLTLGQLFGDVPANTLLARLTMWSSLSLFLGVFLGLVLQGRRLRAD